MNCYQNPCRCVSRGLVLTLVVILGACQSGEPGLPNLPPNVVVNVLPSGAKYVGSIITLDAGKSFDPNGDDLTYEWTLLSRPAASMAELDGASLEIVKLPSDVVGEYQVQVTVSDGTLSSEATQTISVVDPPPTVQISAPDDDEIFEYGTTSVDVTGTIDDPNAIITANGQPVVNTAGAWATSMAVAEGENPIDVVATNSTGEGTAHKTVVVASKNDPSIVILSQKDGFIAGPTLDAAPQRDSTTREILNQTDIVVSGVVKVRALGKPTVFVNGTVAAVQFASLICSAAARALCYNFEATITADLQSSLIIKVEAIDAMARRVTKKVTGYVDYCIKGGFDGLAYYQADAGGRQDNRCHEIDGCSLYDENNAPFGQEDFFTKGFRNDPAKALALITPFGQNRNQASTEFGSGEAPAKEFFIHGNAPQRALPCNLHDQCYQTAGSSKDSCDYNKMYVGTFAVCRKAYPPKCPYSGLEAVFCADWLEEKAACYDAADIYYEGDAKLNAAVQAHDEDQQEYTYPP